MEKNSQTEKAAQYIKDASSKIWNKMQDPQKLMEEVGSTTINILLILAVIIMLWGHFYSKTLESRECKKVNLLYSEVNGKLSSIENIPVDEDAPNNYTHTLKDYYIKTAYNACSTGNYQNSVVSTCILKDIIKQGVRCLDFEIFSLNNKPVVSTSMDNSYFVKETYNYIPFADILNILTNLGTSTSTSPNPTDPIILHLRFNSANQAMYTSLANMFKSIDHYLLGKKYSFENHGKNLGNIPLLELRNKIIIIVDKSNTAFTENEAFKEYVNMTSHSVFMRALTYTNNVKYAPDAQELTTYNKQNMTIVLPDHLTNPENPSGLLSRALGCQLVAMRYQNPDSNLAENETFFNQNGHAYVLKPKKLRYIPVYINKPPPPNPNLSYAPRDIDDPTGLYKFEI